MKLDLGSGLTVEIDDAASVIDITDGVDRVRLTTTQLRHVVVALDRREERRMWNDAPSAGNRYGEGLD